MRNKLLPIILFALLLSCNNSLRNGNDLTNKNNETALNVLDSIKGGNGYIYFPKSMDPLSILKKECKRENPLDHKNVKSALGELLKGDTLNLSAVFSQCGEFGGDKEYILIFNSNTNIDCIVMKDSVSCRDETGNQKFYRIIKNQYTLNDSQSESIVDYIELLTRYSLMEKVNHPTVSNYFSATIIRNVKYRKDFSVDIFDSDGLWLYFDILWNEITQNGQKK